MHCRVAGSVAAGAGRGAASASDPPRCRLLADTTEEGRAVATVDVLTEGPRRHREHVLVFPFQPPAADQRVARALNHMIVREATWLGLIRSDGLT